MLAHSARFPLTSVLLVLSALALPANRAAASPAETWTETCARCHGANGDGRTPTGLKIKAKDYTDAKVQQAFTDAGLLKNLLLGVGADEKPERMPAYKDKLSVAEAKELVALIRTFKK